jgi:hypothetical protein
MSKEVTLYRSKEERWSKEKECRRRKERKNWSLFASDEANELTDSITTDSDSEVDGVALTSTIE